MKVSGSYESVVRGVSQQVPQDRRSGQHTEQINMVSDPVRGLARRHGSRLLAEAAVVGAGSYAALVADTANHRVETFLIDGTEYDLIYRTSSALAGAGAFLWAYNRDTDQFLEVVRPDVDATLDQLVSGGVSASVGIGRYAYIAGNDITPTYTATDLHGDPSNQSKVVAWVRGGAYSQTFKIKLRLNDDTDVEASYKTVESSYPETLDTTDLLSSDPDYQKKVNDRVYAYQSEVTKWIGIAAADITPENIADKLRDELVLAGITGVTVIGGTVCINDATVVEATGDDGGDGSLMRVVGNEVQNADLVSATHFAGKIVKIKPKSRRGDDAFYLEAEPKDEGATGFVDVHWRECAGYVMQPTVIFAMATVFDGTFYIAGGPAALETLAGIDVPGYAANEVGDALSSPLPSFFGRTINFLGKFQDRLVIGSGAVVFAGRPGDYLNLWRQSALTVLDTDPVEMYALGAEEDVIRYSTTFDRDMYLYGNRYQYAISGRTALTPKTGSIMSASAYKSANDAAPKASGNFVFYATYTEGDDGALKTALHQVAAGQLNDNPESTPISQQLDNYASGRPVEIVALASPNMVVLRTETLRNGFYTYSYLDINNNSERIMDAWSKWSWVDAVGVVIGVARYKSGLIAYVLRQRGSDTYVAAEQFTLETALSRYPYADSLQTLAHAQASASMVGAPGAIVALARDGGSHELMGKAYADIATFTEEYPTELARAWVGFPADAYVTPTNPFMRDRNDRPILKGRLTLGQVRVSVTDTGGMLAQVTSSTGDRTALNFNGRIIGRALPVLGVQPIVSTTLPFTVGKEIRQCAYTLRSKAWLPLTITNIEWTGQVFSNTRRVT